jgi:hypothetical protein
MATSPAQVKKPAPAGTTIYDLIREHSIEGMGAAAPKMKIASAAMDSDVLGYVDGGFAPNMMVLNRDLANPKVNAGIRHTIPHEFEHILQNQVDLRGRSAPAAQRTNYDTQVINEYEKLGGSTDKLVTNLRNAESLDNLRCYLLQILLAEEMELQRPNF